MVKTYIDSNRSELENYQKAICALDTIAKEKKLFATEEEIEAEFNQAKRDFEVRSIYLKCSLSVSSDNTALDPYSSETCCSLQLI